MTTIMLGCLQNLQMPCALSTLVVQSISNTNLDEYKGC